MHYFKWKAVVKLPNEVPQVQKEVGADLPDLEANPEAYPEANLEAIMGGDEDYFEEPVASSELSAAAVRARSGQSH